MNGQWLYSFVHSSSSPGQLWGESSCPGRLRREASCIFAPQTSQRECRFDAFAAPGRLSGLRVHHILHGIDLLGRIGVMLWNTRSRRCTSTSFVLSAILFALLALFLALLFALRAILFALLALFLALLFALPALLFALRALLSALLFALLAVLRLLRRHDERGGLQEGLFGQLRRLGRGLAAASDPVCNHGFRPHGLAEGEALDEEESEHHAAYLSCCAIYRGPTTRARMPD